MGPIILKTPSQVAKIKASCQLAAAALRHVGGFVRPGVTTAYLNEVAEAYIRERGGKPAPLGYHGYPKATCISVNEVVCHGIPGDYALRDGDIVNIDISTVLDGYYGDTGYTFPVGNIDPESRKLLDVTRQCLMLGIEAAKPDGFLGDIGHAVSQHAVANGVAVVTHFCGHGVGLEFHEEPQVVHEAAQGSGCRIRPGMVFTVEPMLNGGAPDIVIDPDGWTARTADGRLSAQFEHTIYITNNGNQILTGAFPDA